MIVLLQVDVWSSHQAVPEQGLYPRRQHQVEDAKNYDPFHVVHPVFCVIPSDTNLDTIELNST